MPMIKFEHFMLRISEQYIEISQSTHGDTTEADLFEVWDYLEENLKLPVPVLSTYAKCYTAASEAQLQFAEIARKYYSAIAFVNETPDLNHTEDDIFLPDVVIKVFTDKKEAIHWLKDYGPVEKLEQ